MKKLSFLFLLLSQITFAQSASVTETINKIELKQDTVKSVFDWLANNIKYDVQKLHDIEKGKKPKLKSDYRNEAEYHEALLNKVIKKQKGVCEDYALLFDAIVSELGYESYIVSGYTKDKKGKVSRKIGHAWNAIKVKGSWGLYDATWAAGYVKEDKKFIRHYDGEWYDMKPQEFLKTHMPFDPIWQLSDAPMTYKNFENNENTSHSGAPYNYNELISIHYKKGEKAQMQDEVNRSQEMGDGIGLIKKWRRNMSKNISTYEIHSQPDLLEAAAAKANGAIDLYNDYVAAKNKNFRKKKWTTEYAKQHLGTAKEEMTIALDIYKSINVEDARTTKRLDKAIRQSEKFLRQVDRELSFLDKRKTSGK